MGKTRILVVDDDPTWLDAIELILEGKYQLELAEEPSKAIALMKTASFSLAILDRRLSAGVSGVDLFLQLREIQPDLGAIILTGYASLKDAAESMKLGASDYISKGRQDLAAELRTRVAKALTEIPNEGELVRLIHKGESSGLEFKSSARWDMHQNRANKELEWIIVKTVSAFLNSEVGGVLLIGVDDDGNPIGLQHDYKTLKRQDRDGFENFLVTLLLTVYGKDVSPLIEIDFHIIDGNDVCRISAKPAPRPVFVRDGTGGEHLYIRTGNSTRQLSTREAIEYCKERWK